MRNKGSFSTLIFILVIFGSTLVSGLGVSPSRVTLDYVPNYVLEQDVCFVIHQNAHLRVQAGGAFADYVEITGVDKNSEKTITDGDNCIHYKLTLPEQYENPGRQRTVINAVEVAPADLSGNINVVVSIQHQIDVIIPYPGKYLEITGFQVQNVNRGDMVPITLSVKNRGKEMVGEALANIFFFNSSRDQVAFFEKKEKLIAPLEDRSFSFEWDSEGNPEGRYFAEAHLVYDDLHANASTKFILGGLNVELVDITQEVLYGGIKPFNLAVESLWSEPFESVNARVDLYDNKTGFLTGFDTLTRKLGPWGIENLAGYLDTDATGLGDFRARITIRYDGEIKVYERTISVKPEPEPEKAKPNLSSLFSRTNLLMLLMGLAILVLLIVIYTLIPKKKEKNK